MVYMILITRYKKATPVSVKRHRCQHMRTLFSFLFRDWENGIKKLSGFCIHRCDCMSIYLCCSGRCRMTKSLCGRCHRNTAFYEYSSMSGLCEKISVNSKTVIKTLCLEWHEKSAAPVFYSIQRIL